MTTIKVSRTVCERQGHNFVTTGEDGKSRKVVEGSTEVWQSYICSACGDTIERKIATWQGWVSKKDK